MDSPSRVEFFYSKSRAVEPSLAGDLNWRRYLSNFHDVPGGLLWDGHVFPNVEHAFHYEEYKRTNKPDLGDIYVGEKSQFKSTAKAKVFSGRRAMKENGASLDVKQWDVERVAVNSALLKARWDQDGHFRSILRDSKIKGIKLVHFERGSRKRPPFWGALKLKATGVIIGENRLGKQMMELREHN